MNKIRFLNIAVVLVLMVTCWSPAFAKTGLTSKQESTASAGTSISLTITNPLPKATTVTLTGTKAYAINVPKGATVTKTIDPGKYKYSYQGCLNKPKKGNLKVKGTAAALKITPCKMATWIWYNADDSKPASIRLKGWMNYSVTIGPGQVVSFSWVADNYQATLTACGKTYNDTLKVKGKKSWIIYACK